MNDKKENDHIFSNSHLGGQKMSSSLKDKLKQRSRAFSSPVSQCAAKSPVHNNDQNSESITLRKQISLEDIETCTDEAKLHTMHCNLKDQILNNKEKLRKLELVEHYNLKNKPNDLTALIQKWLTASQEALQKLNEKVPENKSDLSSLLKTLNIDYDVIQYDPDCDSFY